MPKSIPVTTKKRGRPEGRIHSQEFRMRVQPEFMESIDRWRNSQPDKPSRSAAIRMLIEMALASQESPPSISSKLADDLGSFA
jgi:hypothetical protein